MLILPAYPTITVVREYVVEDCRVAQLLAMTYSFHWRHTTYDIRTTNSGRRLTDILQDGSYSI